MKQTIILTILILLASGTVLVWFVLHPAQENLTESKTPETIGGQPVESSTETKQAPERSTDQISPITIQGLRESTYPGSDFVVHETLPNGTNYIQQIVSYQSEDLTIYGLLTIPTESMPESGFSAIVFVHGYIPPKQYSTTGNYPTYQARLARSGMVTFKPDLRGHGNSEGEPVSAHFSEKYVIDTLNAITSTQKHAQVNPERIGYWGHSNGGEIGLRVAVISDNIKAFDLWAGVVGSYEDMFETYNADIPFLQDLDREPIASHGLPSENPTFWNERDPFTYLDAVKVPILMQHGDRDKSVPSELSESLHAALQDAGKDSTLYIYPDADHNISQNTSTAFTRSIQFFEEHL